jgi:hypothetical protein
MKNRIEFEDGMFILGCLDYGHGEYDHRGIGGFGGPVLVYSVSPWPESRALRISIRSGVRNLVDGTLGQTALRE